MKVGSRVNATDLCAEGPRIETPQRHLLGYFVLSLWDIQANVRITHATDYTRTVNRLHFQYSN